MTRESVSESECVPENVLWAMMMTPTTTLMMITIILATIGVALDDG